MIAEAPAVGGGLDVALLREQFPILKERVHGKPLVYLDNAATSQKPTEVLNAISHYYTHTNSNVHRGVHSLSEQATHLYESARERIAHYIGAHAPSQVIYTRGATEGINLVAQSYGRANLQRGDEVLITTMEHHSNIVPWQMVCSERGAVLKAVDITDSGELDMADLESTLSSRTRIVAVVQVSNSLGTVNPIVEICRLAHAAGAVVLVDGAQAMAHGPVDVTELDADFYVFSSHKMLGPTGIGILYGRQSLLENMNPWQGGGDMIRSVTLEETTYNDLPYKFEAGTPHIAGAVGLGAAVAFLSGLDWQQVRRHEADLLEYGTELLLAIPGLRLIGTARHKAAVLSFVLAGVHPHDLGSLLDNDGIAIRTGQHCTEPVMRRFGIPATSRASIAMYNTRAEMETLAESVDRVRKMFA